ncbi:MAG: CYTH domain-containing protein, partial [Turicibacter sp.]
EYLNLLNTFHITEENIWTQKNIYFDTKDSLLKQKDAALRIRVKGANYELTLKTKQEIGLLETNQKITKETCHQLITHRIFPEGIVANTLVDLGLNPSKLRITTDLTTKRAEVNYKNGLLVFDKSFYHDIIDFELEYEVENYEEGLTNFNQFLKNNQIPPREAENKIKRALHAQANASVPFI